MLDLLFSNAAVDQFIPYVSVKNWDQIYPTGFKFVIHSFVRTSAMWAPLLLLKNTSLPLLMNSSWLDTCLKVRVRVRVPANQIPRIEFNLRKMAWKAFERSRRSENKHPPPNSRHKKNPDAFLHQGFWIKCLAVRLRVRVPANQSPRIACQSARSGPSGPLRAAEA